MSADKKKRGSKNFQVSSAGSLGKAPGVGYLGSVSGCPEVDGEKKNKKKPPQNRPTVTAQQFSVFHQNPINTEEVFLEFLGTGNFH